MDWLPALITSGVALATAVAVALLNHRSVRRLAEDKKRTDAESQRQQADARERLVRLENELTSQSEQAAARRSYEYEARKRLYSTVRPMLFELGELAETSNRRIDKILSGVIRLGPDASAVVTTAYRIAAPLVLVHAIQRQLTTVDLRLDQQLRDQYLVARQLLLVLNSGRELAQAPPPIAYEYQDLDDRQHLSVRQLDGLLETLTVRDGDGRPRLAGFFQFQEDCEDPASPRSAWPAAAFRLLGHADPHATPVLWRILATHRLLQQRLLDLLAHDGFPQADPMPPAPCAEPYRSAYEQAMTAARAYLAELSNLSPSVSAQ